jgi:hypothetical protein
MIQTKFAEKIKTHFYSLNYFQKIVPFINVEEHGMHNHVSNATTVM